MLWEKDKNSQFYLCLVLFFLIICCGSCFCLFCFVFLVLRSLTWISHTKLCWYCWACYQGHSVLIPEHWLCVMSCAWTQLFNRFKSLTRFSVAVFAVPLTPHVHDLPWEKPCAVSWSALPCSASGVSFSFRMVYTLLKIRLQIWGMWYFGNIVSSLMLYPQVSESA